MFIFIHASLIWDCIEKEFVSMGFNSEHHHSEINAISNYKKWCKRKHKRIGDIHIYNFAWNWKSKDKSLRLSMPCLKCQSVLKKCKWIKKVFYSIKI